MKNWAYLKSEIYFFKIKYILKKYSHFSQRNKFNMVVQEDSRTSSDGSTTILILESVKNREDEEMILIQMLWREKYLQEIELACLTCILVLILWTIKFGFTYLQRIYGI